ncbi:MAG: hypothetical protein KF824_09635 [Fimbriimonadaceae bacterium]|nr:MAG: hypothetical protein KF824_09635 [Fimbriimonadaceae bacterium]
MITSLAAILCTTSLVTTQFESLDNAVSLSLGVAGLQTQTAKFDPVALSFYRKGLFSQPVLDELSKDVWKTPALMSVIQRDAILVTGKPHALIATASRLTNFGSRRDLLGDPSQPYVTRNPNGLSLDTVIGKYRSKGLLSSEPKLGGLVPDDIKRAAAIVLDAALDNYSLFKSTFPNQSNLEELRTLTLEEAYNGADPVKFDRWLKLTQGTDMAYLIAASQDLTAVANAAKNIAVNSQALGGFTWSVSTKWGDVVLCDGLETTHNNTPLLLAIDLGGNDTYINCPTQKTANQWLSIVIDLGGNDSYLSDAGYKNKPVREGTSRSQQRTLPGPGCGMFGISLILDNQGKDLYRSAAQAFGSATFGSSYLLDSDGDDTYDSYTNSQGFGLFGMGILEDEKGNDTYTTFQQSQGCGLPAGIGWLIDRRGNDTYTAEDSILDFPSPQTAEHNVSMSQGAGYGIRLDYLNGHSLAGGFGMLFDLEGVDTYSAGVFAQGVGYWMGLGALWDRAGKDSYSGVWYVQGSAAHFATGYLQDDDGDDTYTALINMSQGAGHDFSFGMLVDSLGDDKYSGASLALGAGNANGIGAFLDLAGNDQYKASGNAVLGQANESPEGSLRKLSLCLGLFFDQQGNDQYVTQAPHAKNGGRTAQNSGAPGSTQGTIGVFWDQ